MNLGYALPPSDQISTRQQKGQPLEVGLFACRSTTCRNSMWSGRWESKTSSGSDRVEELCLQLAENKASFWRCCVASRPSPGPASGSDWTDFDAAVTRA